MTLVPVQILNNVTDGWPQSESRFNTQLNIWISFLVPLAHVMDSWLYMTDPLRSVLLAPPARLNSCSLLRHTSDSTSSVWSFHSTATENRELHLREVHTSRTRRDHRVQERATWMTVCTTTWWDKSASWRSDHSCCSKTLSSVVIRHSN